MAVVVMAVVVMAVVVIVILVVVVVVLVAMNEAKHHSWIDRPLTNGKQRRSFAHLRLERGAHGVHALLGHQIRPTDQHQIGCVQLISKQLINGGDVIQARVVQPLVLESLTIRHRMSSGHGFPIHHGDHTVNVNTTSDRRPLQGLQQRTRQSKATCLHNDAVQVIRPLQQPLHRRQEVVLHRAAETSVVELDESSLDLLLRTEATAADQITIQTDTAEFVDHYSQSLTTVGQQMAQKRRFACTKETGDDGHR